MRSSKPGTCLWSSFLTFLFLQRGFPDSSVGKESACNAGDLGSIPGLGRSPGEGKGYWLQYSGLENSMDYIVHGVPKSRTGLRLSLSLFLQRLDSSHYPAQLLSVPLCSSVCLVFYHSVCWFKLYHPLPHFYQQGIWWAYIIFPSPSIPLVAVLLASQRM